MKKDEIKIGHCYTAKVSGKLATVRINGVNPHGGWDAMNITTGKRVRVKSAQRLRHETRVSEPKKADATPAPKDDATPAPKPTTPVKKKSGGHITEANKANAVNEAMLAVEASKKKRASGLDVAAAVLTEAGKPMKCTELVDQMLNKGLWKTNGKTPAATIYAAIIREIRVKGSESRFKKTDRGMFAAA